MHTSSQPDRARMSLAQFIAIAAVLLISFFTAVIVASAPRLLSDPYFWLYFTLVMCGPLLLSWLDERLRRPDQKTFVAAAAPLPAIDITAVPSFDSLPAPRQLTTVG